MRHEAREIAWHTRQLFTRLNTDEPIVRARLSETGEGLQVLVYTRDEPDLFARICAFFEKKAGYSIFDAHIQTTRHGYALDSFYVYIQDHAGQNYRDLIGYVEYELATQIAHNAPLRGPGRSRISRQQKHFPIRPSVSIRPDERGGRYSIVEIVAGDRAGLLSAIAAILATHRIEIHAAKIMTLASGPKITLWCRAMCSAMSAQCARSRAKSCRPCRQPDGASGALWRGCCTRRMRHAQAQRADYNLCSVFNWLEVACRARTCVLC